MKKSIVVLLFILLSLISIASLGVAVYSYRQIQSVKKTPTTKPDTDQIMLETIASSVLLPDEKPTIINVTDRDKLQDQEFFKKAQNGDKVIIYESIRRIFLYRPSLNKIIDVAPLVFTGQQAATQSGQQITPTAAKPVMQKSSTSSAESVGVEEQGNFRIQP